jgi:hypothetical protein
MSRWPFLAAALLGWLPASPLSAADPLEYIPATAQVVIVSDTPRQFVEAMTGLEAVRVGQKLPQYSSIYNSTAVKRTFQFVKLFETQLGAAWPELIDQLAGAGIAFGFQFGDDPAPAILVLQGTSEGQVKKATDLALKIIADELARQGSKDGLKRIEIAGNPTVAIGEFRMVRLGATTLISTSEAMFKAAIELAMADRAKVPGFKARREAFKLLPEHPLAWLWLDFASVKQSKQTKDFFDATRQDFLQTLVVGGTIDCLKRADFIAAGLYKEATGFRFTLRLPAGRAGFPPEFQLHVPPKGEAGSLPILEPPGTIYSQSFHLDIAHLWQNRKALLNDEIRKGLETAETNGSKFLPGAVRFGDLLAMWGPYHRIVVANHDALPYKKLPGQRFPAFAYVASSRDPRFARCVEPALRSAALLATLQLDMKMTELNQDGVAIVAYRFPENKKLPSDPEGIRFNFEPCFASVDDRLVVASTVELCKKLIKELKAPRSEGKVTTTVLRGEFAAPAASEAVSAVPDPLITDAILARGVGIEEARKDVAALLAWVRALGSVRLELDIAESEYRVDLVWTLPGGQR